MQDLKDAEIKVIAGPEKKSRVIPQHERELTAYHEAGHAVVMHMLPGQDPVSQITIVPRGMAGGMTISLPEEDRSYLSKHYMEDQIVGLLGGRVAGKAVSQRYFHRRQQRHPACHRHCPEDGDGIWHERAAGNRVL